MTKDTTTWNGHDIFTIKIAGSRDFVRDQIDTLVEDFERYEEGGDYLDEQYA